jgi:Protein of unknown function (DUF1217)
MAASLAALVQTVLGISSLTSMADVDKQASMLTKLIDFKDFQNPDKLKTILQRFSAMWEGENGQAMSTTATPSILVDQPIELGLNAATLTSLQNLKIGR